MRVKRVYDIVISIVGLVFLIPAIVLIGILINIKMGPPIFYSQIRVGKNGTHFRIYKFRTMHKGADKMVGGSITVVNDHRITPIGKYLRRYKLDELPSLWCVLRGDMSLVGPRPDVPGYTDQLRGDDRRVLQLRPGLTGPATLKYSNEEKLLSEVDYPKKYNDEIIFPDKVKINLDYLEKWSPYLDIKIIIKTIFRRNY